MKYVKTPVRLIISGKIENLQEKERIHSIIRENDLEHKVEVVDRWISENEKADYYAKCLAAIYIPYDEDSYGYPSLEAHHSRKAVISCTDSGGTDELILDGENGFLVEPDPEKLAAIFDQLYEDKKLAEKMGQRALKRIEELDITWDNVIRRFTE